MASPLDIFRASMDGADRGRERGLAQLLGKAYSAPREQRSSILGQVASLGAPQAAFDAENHFRSMDGNARADFGRYAVAFDALPDAQKAVEYPNFARQAQQFGIPAPLEWKPEFAPNISKLAQALGGGGTGGMVQSTYVNGAGQRVAIMRDGSQQILGANDAGMANQTVTVEGPNGEPMQYTFNKRTGTYQPMGAGAALPASNVTLGQPMPFTIGADIPPQVAAQIRAQEEAAGGQFVGAPQSVPASLPPPLDFMGGGQVGVGMGAAEKAAAQEAAKQAVDLANMPRRGQLEADNAAMKARAEAQAKADVERAVAQAKKAFDAGNTLDVLDSAETLLKTASGGAIQAGRDRVFGAFNVSTEGAQATAGLKLLAAKLIANVPRFEGPQSNIDVQFYREAAGDLANDALPTETRLAALQTMRQLNMKYAGSTGGRDEPPGGDLGGMSDDDILRALR